MNVTLRQVSLMAVMGAVLAPAHFAIASELPRCADILFSGSGNCAFCHEQWSGALLDADGNSVSISADWQASMMAHSFVDPLWRARMEAEILDQPDLKEFIEDKCMTCHAPMARTLFHHEEDAPYPLAKALKSQMALDGVSCSLCHQIQPGNLGTEESLDGGYLICTNRLIFGPYEDVVTGPMRNHVDYTPIHGAHVQDSAFCGTCHTLFIPILDPDGRQIGLFPEQVPYLEWENSIYNQENRHCQDCHMPRLNEPIRISARPPWIGTQKPFWRHTFAGANTFMLQLFWNYADALGARADAGLLTMQADRTRALLSEQTASLSAKADRKGNELHLAVTVVNKTGHKFPTGYPYRRVWLRVQVYDHDGRILFVSGGVDQEGCLKCDRPSGYAPHYREIVRSDQVQIYEAVMQDRDGTPTEYLLRAHGYLKDNRILPKGYRSDGPHSERTAVHGAASADPDYLNGSGSDSVIYRIVLPESGTPVRVQIDLLYQPVPPEAVAGLLDSEAPAAAAFAGLYRKADKRPAVIQSLELALAPDSIR